MNTVAEKKPKELGRPRAFNKEEALDKALMLFWQKGYEGTSLADLTEALAINKPSLYAAFGNKEDLFRQAMLRYQAGPVAYIKEAFKAPTARQAVEMFLNQSADLLTNPENPRGCLAVQGALSCSDGAHAIKQELIQLRKNTEGALCRRLQRAQQDGDFPQTVNAADFARYIATVHQGLSVQAATGANRAQMQSVIDFLLNNWPS